jgi:hypothetical protein
LYRPTPAGGALVDNRPVVCSMRSSVPSALEIVTSLTTPTSSIVLISGGATSTL